MYYINIIKEIFIGIFLIVFGVLIIVSISNTLSKLLENHLNKIFLFIIHLFIIIGFIIIIQNLSKKVMFDKNVLSGVNSIIGPTVATSSFYFAPFMKDTSLKIYNYIKYF
jgi:hypothetical protein